MAKKIANSSVGKIMPCTTPERRRWSHFLSANQRKPRIVILSDQDKPEMEAEIRARVTQRGRTRIICRSGNPLDLNNLDIANPQSARSIIILPRPVPERTLIFNWNSRTPRILTELDSYVAPGSVTTVVVRDAESIPAADALLARLRHVHVDLIEGDPTDRELLDRLDLGSYDHVIVLGEFDTLDAQEADARTLTTLLRLRSIHEQTHVQALAAAGSAVGLGSGAAACRPWPPREL
jgi:hypothetical protein